VDAADDDGHTALVDAAALGRSAIVGMLLDAGADPALRAKDYTASGGHFADDEGEPTELVSALHASIANGAPEVSRLLLARVPGLADLPTTAGRVPLRLALETNRLVEVIALLEFGADVSLIALPPAEEEAAAAAAPAPAAPAEPGPEAPAEPPPADEESEQVEAASFSSPSSSSSSSSANAEEEEEEAEAGPSSASSPSTPPGAEEAGPSSSSSSSSPSGGGSPDADSAGPSQPRSAWARWPFPTAHFPIIGAIPPPPPPPPALSPRAAASAAQARRYLQRLKRSERRALRADLTARHAKLRRAMVAEAEAAGAALLWARRSAERAHAAAAAASSPAGSGGGAPLPATCARAAARRRHLSAHRAGAAVRGRRARRGQPGGFPDHGVGPAGGGPAAAGAAAARRRERRRRRRQRRGLPTVRRAALPQFAPYCAACRCDSAAAATAPPPFHWGQLRAQRPPAAPQRRYT